MIRPVSILLSLAAAPASAQAPAPPVRAPAMALALEAAKAAVAACEGKTVAVVVTDAAGGAKLVYVPDGTAAWIGDFARRKAATVIRTGRSSGEAAAAAKTDPQIAALFASDKSLLAFAGGLPLKIGGQLIGAIAVAGAGPPEEDEACTKAGLAAISDRLR